ncbi:hypothetical protein GMLC_36160 [Geomonas limicola]|uniref:Uncharacterized protein n=1 Tax=Geomonas limicola TaxID=2740186 RepID=A0A6V8NE27_9BACT|nr:ABC-three component system middle component 1 [Geomonas limicola]GFO70037.1 hypothetical protein GMLC_36160 [Geomonas limicola]
MIALDLLLKIFSQNKCKVVEFTLNNFRGFFASTEGESEYYMVLDKEYLESEEIKYLISEGVGALAKKIKTFETYTPCADKNTVLIICMDASVSLLAEGARIEEDAFTFKKNVLRYSKASVFQLNEALAGDYTKSNLSSHLFNPDRFDDMKSKVEPDEYKLLLDVFIKVPMLTLDGNKIKKIKNLSEKVRNRLSKLNLGILLDETLNTHWDSVEGFDDISKLCLLIDEV